MCTCVDVFVVHILPECVCSCVHICIVCCVCFVMHLMYGMWGVCVCVCVYVMYGVCICMVFVVFALHVCYVCMCGVCVSTHTLHDPLYISEPTLVISDQVVRYILLVGAMATGKDAPCSDVCVLE